MPTQQEIEKIELLQWQLTRTKCREESGPLLRECILKMQRSAALDDLKNSLINQSWVAAYFKDQAAW